jgi:plastocyanin
MKKRIIKPALLICIFISLIGMTGFYACSKSGGGYGNNNGSNGTGDAVSIQNFAFSVGTLTVTSGTTVTWTNNDATTHTVTADDGSFNSGNIAPGSKFSHTFSAKGTVNYHCSIHPMMKASVVVN